MTDETFTFRSTDSDGTIRETEITAGQALDLGVGHGFAYFPRDERVLIDDEGQVTLRESAIPQRREAAP